jgi:diguanylate cyclase (GGDEF)-like protein
MASHLSPRLLAGFGSLLLVIVGLGILALSLMDDLSERAERIALNNIPELTKSAEVQTSLQEYRQLQLRHLVEPSPAEKSRLETELPKLGSVVSGGLQDYERVAPEQDERQEARRLLSTWERYVRQSSPFLAFSRRGDGAGGVTILTGRADATFKTLHEGLVELQAQERAEAGATLAAGQKAYRVARTTFIVVVLTGVFGAGALGLWFLVIRPLRRAAASETYRRRFQEALEMADTEDEALEVTGRALGQACPEVSAELLLADSSQAHLHRALIAGPDPAGPGCPVDAPRACAAVRRGQMTVFASSEAVGACPRLRDRPGGPCSAVCTPVTVLGRTIGVLHATGPVGHPPAGSARDALETTGTQIGSRLGVIRAMSQSQLQASTDPLTGLLNRRSLEDRVQDLRRAGIPFVVAMADLDHFKMLNDSFGHETGDRALRLFSRTMVEAVRVQDIVARHGGEEFVIIFPRCSTIEAAEVIERARTALQTALMNGEVPEFTCSVGVAEAGPDEAFHDVLRAADEALMGAKRSGRDRVLIAPSIRPASIEVRV